MKYETGWQTNSLNLITIIGLGPSRGLDSRSMNFDNNTSANSDPESEQLKDCPIDKANNWPN